MYKTFLMFRLTLMALLRVTVLVFDLREEIEQYSTVFLVLINRARSNRLRQSKHTKSTHHLISRIEYFIESSRHLIKSEISIMYSRGSGGRGGRGGRGGGGRGGGRGGGGRGGFGRYV